MSQNIEQYYDDGTEPTILRRLPVGCDQQGRYPEAAEAATEIGADDDHDPYMQAFIEDVVMAVCGFVVVCMVGLAVWSLL